MNWKITGTPELIKEILSSFCSGYYRSLKSSMEILIL